MSTSKGPGNSGDAPAIGIGGPTSGEAGSTPGHESMAETGGSGGPALTKPRNEERDDAMQSGERGNRQGESRDGAEGAGTAATAITRGAQDTRSQQAGINPTGLGAPETGGNQSEDDLAPPYNE